MHGRRPLGRVAPEHGNLWAVGPRRRQGHELRPFVSSHHHPRRVGHDAAPIARRSGDYRGEEEIGGSFSEDSTRILLVEFGKGSGLKVFDRKLTLSWK